MISHRSHKSRIPTAWFLFWEGALIAHFFGLVVAAYWCAAWWLLAVGVVLVLKTAKGS